MHGRQIIDIAIQAASQKRSDLQAAPLHDAASSVVHILLTKTIPCTLRDTYVGKHGLKVLETLMNILHIAELESFMHAQLIFTVRNLFSEIVHLIQCSNSS